MWSINSLVCRGFAHLELLLVVTLILVMIGTLLREAHTFYQASEKVQVETVLMNIRTATHSLVTERFVESDMDDLASYQGSNPLSLLPQKPVNYREEDSAEPATWFFNRQQGVLVYRLRDPGKVASVKNSKLHQLSFRFQLNYQDNNQNQQFDRAVDSVTGLRLESLNDYRWLN